MKRVLSIVLFIWIIIPTAYAHKLSNIAPYPAARVNENRNIIWLDKIDNEDHYKIEIIASKQGVKDCNQASYSTELNRKYIQNGMHYYFVMDKQILRVSTLMGCPNTKEIFEEFPILLTKGESMQPYNSQLPIVIYTPKDVHIKFRIWKADVVKSAVISND